MLKSQMKCIWIFHYFNHDVIQYFKNSLRRLLQGEMQGWNWVKEKKSTSNREEKKHKLKTERKILLYVWPFPQKETRIEWEREKAPWWNPFVWVWLPTICWFSIWCTLCVILTAHTWLYNTVHKHTFFCILEAHIFYTFCSISQAHTLKRLRMQRRHYGHRHKCEREGSHIYTKGMHRNMHTAHRRKTWHSLPWLQTHWMNHPEICPFSPKHKNIKILFLCKEKAKE